MDISSPNMENVSSLGFDLKTDNKNLTGHIWIDYIRLIDKEGREELFFTGDNLEFNFSEHSLVWIAGAREYPREYR